MEEIWLTSLRLVVEIPLFTAGFIHPTGGFLGFLNHQRYDFMFPKLPHLEFPHLNTPSHHSFVGTEAIVEVKLANLPRCKKKAQIAGETLELCISV